MTYISTYGDPTNDISQGLTIQEHRLQWLVEFSKETFVESKMIPKISYEEAIYCFLKGLHLIMKTLRISYIQATWKAYKQKRLYQKMILAAKTIQAFFRNCKACRPSRKQLKIMKAEYLRQIFLVEKRNGNNEKKNPSLLHVRNTKKEKKSLLVVKNTKILSDTDNHEDIDSWLRKENDPINLFDSKMGRYLATERLSHYPKANKKKVKREKEIKRPEILRKFAAYGEDATIDIHHSENGDSDSELDMDDNYALDILNTKNLGIQRTKMMKKVIDQVL